MWIGFDGLTLPDHVAKLLRDGDIGGISLFARNIRDARQLGDLVREVHAARPTPIAVDQEGGSVVRIAFGTVFPSAMAFGAADDPALTERAAAVVGRELRTLGIGVDLAPVCDVNVEAANPVVGTRAFSDDPARVGRHAAAVVRGLRAAGVAATAKHFPGHGATALDSHLALPTVVDDRETIQRRDLGPFRAAIAAGAPQVMTAHVVYPALDARPATYSRPILRDLLRGELGFAGPICSDALEMAGAQLEGTEPAAAAIAAGVDVAHVCQPEPGQPARALDAIERATARGEITAARLADALARARAFAARWTVAPADAPLAPDHALAIEVAARAITAVGPPPPNLRSGALVVAAFPPSRRSLAEELRDPLAVLERTLRARFGAALAFVRLPAAVEVPPGATLIVVTSSAHFDAAQLVRARELLSCRPSLLVALRSPYDAAAFPGVPALLTYSDVPASCEALAQVLAGEREARGQLPVRMPAPSGAMPT